jgi:hypothetical protein
VALPLTPDDADRIARQYFATHYPDSGGRFGPIRAAHLPQYDKVYYVLGWALAREPTEDEDGGYIGSGGFLVSLQTGRSRAAAVVTPWRPWFSFERASGFPSMSSPR